MEPGADPPEAGDEPVEVTRTASAPFGAARTSTLDDTPDTRRGEAVPPTAGPGIVIADDSEDFRFLVRLELTRAGYEILAEVDSGDGSVTAAAEHQPAAVLLDLGLPGMDGLTAIPKLRQVAPATRILVISGFDDGRMRRAALDAGADCYLVKPISLRDLVGELADVLARAPMSPRPPSTADGLVLDAAAIALLVHELRTPLTVIQGMLETMRTHLDTLPREKMTRVLDAAHRGARQLTLHLDDLAMAKQIAGGQISIRKEATDLVALVRETVADLDGALAGHPVEIVAPDGLIAEMDPPRIRQVLAHLLTNAAKFSPPEAPVTVTVRPNQHGASVAVEDQGIGVPEGRREHLFDAFERLGRTGKGLGLGLFISRAIARAHGGEVLLARTSPSGSTFLLSLPHAESPGSD